MAISVTCECARDKYLSSWYTRPLPSKSDVPFPLTAARLNSCSFLPLRLPILVSTQSIYSSLIDVHFLVMVKITILVLAIVAAAQGGILHKDGPMPAIEIYRRWANATTSHPMTAVVTSYIAANTSSTGTWWQGTPSSCIPLTWSTTSCTTSPTF